jgi:hypothetical protein
VGWFHGLPVLGIPGANVVDKALSLGLVASIPRLYVVQEPGGSGEDFVRNVLSTLARVGWSGELLVVRLPVKDLSDLHCADPDSFLMKWQAATESAVQHTVGASDAAATPPTGTGVPVDLPWPEALAEEAYHGLAGEIVRAIEPSSEAHPAALLTQTLVGFGNIVGRTGHFRVEDDRHFGNEFVVLVGRTSKARKGTSWGRVHRLLSEAEEQWAADRVQTGLSSGEGVIWAVRDPIQKRERVKERGEPVRYEEVEADPGVCDKRLLVYEPEFANVLRQIERTGNSLSSVLRVAWESRDLRTMTKNNPARVTGAHISLIGHCTVEELRRYLSATEQANGFGNRHVWICVRRSKLLAEGGAPTSRPSSGCASGWRRQSRLPAASSRCSGRGRRGRSGVRSTASCPRASRAFPAPCSAVPRPT